MKRAIFFPLFVLAAAGLTGCLSFARSPKGTSMPSYVGERNTVGMGTVVAPVWIEAAEAPCLNLSVSLEALVDTRKTTILWDTQDVRRIVWRNQPRIAARVVETASGARIAEAADLSELRAEIASEAQKEFDAVFSQWSDADKFSVRIVVTAMHLGSPDVGYAGRRDMWGY